MAYAVRTFKKPYIKVSLELCSTDVVVFLFRRYRGLQIVPSGHFADGRVTDVK